VKSLIEILNECGVVDQTRLESKWRAECDKLNEATDGSKSKKEEKGRKAKRKTTASG